MALDWQATTQSGMMNPGLSYPSMRRPLNLNDSDLDPNMKELPAEREGPTEMMFCLLRCEMGKVMLSIFSPPSKDSLRSNGTSMEKQIDELESLIESKFLRYCDPLVPLHYFTAIVARSAVSMLRLGAHGLFTARLGGAPDVSIDEKRTYLSQALKVIEYSNHVQTSPTTQKFLWHVNANLQWHVLIFLLFALKDPALIGPKQAETTAELEVMRKAWSEVDKAFTNRPQIIDDHSIALHAAISSLALKAWEAREKRDTGHHNPPNEIRDQGSVPMPRFVDVLRTKRASQVQNLQNASKDHASDKQAFQEQNTATLASSTDPIYPDMQQPYSNQPFNTVLSWDHTSETAVNYDQHLVNPFPTYTNPLSWDEWDKLLEHQEWYGNGAGGY